MPKEKEKALWPSHRPVQRRPQALEVTCVVVVTQMDAKGERVGQRKDASSLPGKKRVVMCFDARTENWRRFLYHLPDTFCHFVISGLEPA